MRCIKLCVAACCVFLLLAGCSSDHSEEGVVATVNGKPIYLHEVESRYDLDKLSWAAVYVPTVESLRLEYGQALSELIVSHLLAETLNENNLQVTDKELEEAEAVVRADYPEGQFEKVMVEEYIDLDVWRLLLRQQLAIEKFKQAYLRPRIKLTYQEAEAYYKAHLSDFYLPARVHFLLITGQDREQVVKARELFKQNPDIDAVRKAFDGISVRDLKMPLTRMPAAWATVIESLKSGESSDVAVGGNRFESLVLLKHLPAKVLDPTRAYPLVEKVLLEKKFEIAFNEWLTDKLNQTDIKISKLLLERVVDDVEHPDASADVSADAAVEESTEEGSGTFAEAVADSSSNDADSGEPDAPKNEAGQQSKE